MGLPELPEVLRGQTVVGDPWRRLKGRNQLIIKDLVVIHRHLPRLPCHLPLAARFFSLTWIAPELVKFRARRREHKCAAPCRGSLCWLSSDSICAGHPRSRSSGRPFPKTCPHASPATSPSAF